MTGDPRANVALLDRLRELDRDCREATADAERQTAGMREVALFRAANAKAVMGGYALGLAERLVEAEAAVRAGLALADEWEADAQRQVDVYSADSDVLPAVVGRSWVNASRQFRAVLTAPLGHGDTEEPSSYCADGWHSQCGDCPCACHEGGSQP